jgi:hypothetical protein
MRTATLADVIAAQARHAGRTGMANALRVCLVLLWVLPTAGRGACEPVSSAPAAAVASGSPLWVDSNLDPEYALINARVDIGSLAQSGDTIEAKVAWPLIGHGSLIDASAAHPGVTIPKGSNLVETAQVVCRENHALYYTIQESIVSPDGKTLDRQVFNAAEQRTKAEGRERANLLPFSYGSDAYSLVCWAAAQKCEGTDYRWPPPPNLSPLEHSERATKMNAEYNRPFIPHCRLAAEKSSN